MWGLQRKSYNLELINCRTRSFSIISRCSFILVKWVRFFSYNAQSNPIVQIRWCGHVVYCSLKINESPVVNQFNYRGPRPIAMRRWTANGNWTSRSNSIKSPQWRSAHSSPKSWTSRRGMETCSTNWSPRAIKLVIKVNDPFVVRSESTVVHMIYHCAWISIKKSNFSCP